MTLGGRRFDSHKFSKSTLLPRPCSAFVSIEPLEVEDGGLERFVFVAPFNLLAFFDPFAGTLDRLFIDVVRFLEQRFELDGDYHVTRTKARPVRRFVEI